MRSTLIQIASLVKARFPQCLEQGFFYLCFSNWALGKIPPSRIYLGQTVTKKSAPITYPTLKILDLTDLKDRKSSLENLVNNQGLLEWRHYLR